MKQMTIRSDLERILPEVLPESPDEAIWGTRLAEIILRDHGLDAPVNTLLQYFSDMSRDPTSRIAKRVGRNGYYKRPRQLTEAAVVLPESENRRDFQPEEKFRSLFMRWVQQEQQFPWHLDHTHAVKQQAGINKWKYPDVLVVNWDVLNDEGRLDEAMLQVRQGLGDQPFRIISTELKVEVAASSLREVFFQCVSNSRWAHSAQLVIACEISDDRVAEELKRLGTSYDVSVFSFGLSAEMIAKLPPANKLRDMREVSDDEVENLLRDVRVETIASGQERDALDWEHIRDLQTQHPDIKAFFEWIAKCLEHKRAYTRDTWLTIK
jgi:hypothetical protein